MIGGFTDLSWSEIEGLTGTTSQDKHDSSPVVVSQSTWEHIRCNQDCQIGVDSVELPIRDESGAVVDWVTVRCLDVSTKEGQ